MNTEILIYLLIGLQIKHFICDYPLQNAYMLQKGGLVGWVKPLLAHSSVHAVGTFIVFLYFGFKIAILFSLIDFVLHFVVDRIKACPTIGGKYNPTQPYFWWALGLDQMAHHIINILFVAFVLYFHS